MATINVDAAAFTLRSDWRVVTGSNGVKEIVEGPTMATNTVSFEYKISSHAKVISAKVHSTWGEPLSGYAIRTVNGKVPDADGWADVEVDPAQGSLAVQFAFKANGNTTSTGDRYAVAEVTDIYLLIETEGGSGYIYKAENGELVPYKFHRVENGVLVPYNMLCATQDYERVIQTLLMADGKQLYTSDSKQFKVLGG